MKQKHKGLFYNWAMVIPITILFIAATCGYSVAAPAAPKNLRTGTATGVQHYFTGLPMTHDGWTDLVAMVQAPDQYTNSRIVYVSTSGNDSTGKYYSITDTEIGSNPFEPSGTVLPYATFAAASAELRDGYADILLLKRGDTWINNPTVIWTKSGASNTARIIIGAYGSSGDRPVLASDGYMWMMHSGTVSNIIITNIEMYPYDRQSSENPVGIRWVGAGGSNILIEGCYFHHYANNITFNDTSKTYNPTQVALRRNVISDAWSEPGDGMGIYTAYIGDMLIEENVWDHNGWHKTLDPQNVYSRNLYLDYYSGQTLIVRGNIDARSSSEGTQMRYGGTYKHNLSLQNTAAVQMGHAQTKYEFTGEITKNVVLDANDIEGRGGRGYGILVGNRAVNTLVDDNIIAHNVTSVNGKGLLTSDEDVMMYQENPPLPYVTNPKFTNNIVWNWQGTSSTYPGYAFFLGRATDGITAQNNIIQSNGTGIVYYRKGSVERPNNGPDASWNFSGNTYYTTDPTPFDARDESYALIANLTFAEWDSVVGDTGSTFSQASFTDSNRTIETYVTAQGLNPSDYEDGLDKFLTRAKAQSRFNWDEDYTAYAVINYVRAGFDRDAVSADYANP